MRLPPETEHDLIVTIQQNKDTTGAAFGSLYAAYERQIFGFIRGRTHDDQSAQHIAQATRRQVWEKMATYDATRARFHTFAKYWAGFMLLRYYAAQKRQSRLLVLFSELQTRYPELGQEQEIGDILARVSAQKYPSVEEQKRVHEEEATQTVEVHEELLQLTFGGSSPPHQAIAVGFRNLGAEETSQALQEHGEGRGWPPRRMVHELSDTSLSGLQQRLEDVYIDTSHLPEERVRGHFAWLRHSMQRRIEEVVTEPRTRQTHAALLRRRVGATTFRHYYTHLDNPAQDIMHWCEAVKRRVWSAVKQKGTGPLFLLLQAAERQKPYAGRSQEQCQAEPNA
jgi:DNA-directed RNA polymerase specialized sigma24 family protein